MSGRNDRVAAPGRQIARHVDRHARARPLASAAVLMLASVIVCGLLSVHMKQDDNWDLQNYHIYTAFSLLDGRLAKDFWSGHLQIYFNPLQDLPYYLLSTRWLPGHPRMVAFLAGLPYAALVPLAASISWCVLPVTGRHRRPVLAALAALIGLTGSTTTAEIGTVFGDLPTAVFVLAGLLCTIATVQTPRRWLAGCALAGLCLGGAAGLKLTAAVYAPALAAAVLVCGPRGRRLVGSAAFILCWAVACLPPLLWWGHRLDALYGNPVFPLLNGLFHSPFASAASMRDTRFLPHGALQAIAYPFYWLAGRPFVVTEGSLREPRFAAAYVALLWLAVRSLGGRLPSPPARILIVTTAVAFALWEAVFSILRYAIPLEILTGPIIALAVCTLGDSAHRRGRAAPALLAGLLVCMLVFQKQQTFGRLKRYGATVFDISIPALPDNAAVVVTGHKLSFVVPFLAGRNLTFIGLTAEPPTMAAASAVSTRLAAASAVFSLENAGSTAGEAALDRLGWQTDRGACTPVHTAFQAGIILCSTVSRVRPHAQASLEPTAR